METQNNSLGFITAVLIALLIINGIFIFVLIMKVETDKFRQSPEGICLTNKAIEICNSKDIVFKKLYCRSVIWCDYDFACNDRSNIKNFNFNLKELMECGL